MNTRNENNSEVDRLLAVVNQIDSLPTLPEVIEKLTFKLYDSKATAEILAKSMSADTALVSKVLKLVNSAYYGFPRKISTVSQAIVFLGFNSLKNIILTASIFKVFNENGKSSQYDRRKFWEHSLACAVMSKILCKYSRAGLPEEAFFAGLIHDIGKIVIDQFVHDKFVQIIQILNQKEVSFAEAEQEILGTDHAEIGKWLCDKWNFPTTFLNVIYYHHIPADSPSNKKMVAVVHLANSLVKLEGFGITPFDKDKDLHTDYFNFLNISEGETSGLKKDFYEDYKKADIFLELVN